MASINIFDTVSSKSTTIKANGKLKDIFPELDFSHSLVIKAGCRLDGNYECTEEDVLYVRRVPTSTAVIAVISIIVAVVAVGVGVGSALYAKKQSDEAKAEMDKAQRNAQNMAAATQQLPFIRGAKNRKALGETVQFIMGSVYNTPYNVTDGYYSIDGADGINSYYNAVFSLGYGRQRVRQVLLGNENICSNQEGISGVNNFDSTSLYYDESNSNKVEVCQPGELVTLANGNQKVSSTYSGAPLKHDFGQEAVPVIVQAAENAMSIQVCIMFSCLRQYNSAFEVWQERTAIVRPYWSNDGGATWNQFYFDGTTDNTFVKNSNRTLRYVATKNFTAAESYGKQISIKVVKETPQAAAGSQEECALLWYQTFQYDALKSSASSLTACTPLEEEIYNKVTRVAYRIIANDSTQNIVDELHAMTDGYALTWDGTAWSSQKNPTRNPASWLLEVLTSDIHLPSKYDISEIDLNSFAQLYEYCETNNFYCDGIIVQGEKKLDILTKILSLCNSTLIVNQEGLLEVVTDKEEQNPVALLNSENIVSFSFSKSLQKKVDGTKVTYLNKNTWSVDTFYAMLDGGDYNYSSDTVDTLALDYVTEYEHAYKMAQRKERQIQLQPREIKVDVGSEGDFYPLYSKILLQLPHLLQGLGSSVITGITTNEYEEITEISVSDAFTFAENTRYGIIIQATNNYGYKLFNVEVDGVFADENASSGITRRLSFVTPLDIGEEVIVPVEGNHLSFGLLDNNGQFTKITNEMKIYGIEPNGSDGFTLALRDYNEEVYSYGGAIPAYKTNTTRPQKGGDPVSVDSIANLRQDMNKLQEDLINAYQMLEMPVVVDADVKSVLIETGENGTAATTQRVTTQVTCRQGWEDRPFSIGTINVPAGWSYEVVGGQVVFTIPEGSVVRSGQFKIPVEYYPIISYEQYADENGDTYIDENNDDYMAIEGSPTSYTYDIWFSYIGVDDGVYLGLISDLENIPSVTNVNDYFTWGGENTVSSLSIEGRFRKARTYKFIGLNKAWKWEVDEDVGHGVIAMSDVFSVANADLQSNNSQAWQYLNHLTSNSIYTDMLVANTALIERLVTRVIAVGDFISVGDAHDYADTAAETAAADELDDYIESTGITRNYTVIENGKIVTGLIDVNAIKAAQGFFTNITVTGEFQGDLHCNYNEEKGTYAFEVYDQMARFSGEVSSRGLFRMSFVSSDYEILGITTPFAYHPKTIDDFYTAFDVWARLINADIRDGLTLALRRSYFPNNNYTWYAARGYMYFTTANSGSFQMTVTSVGLYNLNDTVVSYMGIVQGFTSGYTVRVFFSVLESRLEYSVAAQTSAGIDKQTNQSSGSISSIEATTIVLY